MQAEKKLSRMGGAGGGWLVGLVENKANSAQLELEFGMSLAKTPVERGGVITHREHSYLHEE